MPAQAVQVPRSELRARRREIEARLRSVASRPRRAHRAPPPDGRLSPGEEPAGQLRVALDALGPVFADFRRYLASRVDLLPRRSCLELADRQAIGGPPVVDRGPTHHADIAAIVDEQLDGVRERVRDIEPAPCGLTPWTQQHAAWVGASEPVAVRIVRSDAARLLATDLPMLSLLEPWLGLSAGALAAAIDDFSETLRGRIDQAGQAAALNTLADDAKGGGGLDAPVCYREYCAGRLLTSERIGQASIAEAIDGDAAARRLASAWIHQALSGRVVPYEFDLRDLRVWDGRLVLVDGALEPQTASERDRFARYLAAVAADDPDAAWDWIAAGATPLRGAEPEPRLRSRLRQAVPFRDGEWTGENRLAERLLVQWRAVREAGWTFHRHHLHLYRGIHAIADATTRLAPRHDVLLAALHEERLRLGIAEVRRLTDPLAMERNADRVLQDIVLLPQKLDEFLTQAAEGRLRVKLRVADAEESRQTKNRTVSLIAGLAILVAIAFLVRHLAPEYGASVERIGAILLLAAGGWLLVAAARL